MIISALANTGINIKMTERNTCIIFIIVLLLVILPTKIVKKEISSKFYSINLEFSGPNVPIILSSSKYIKSERSEEKLAITRVWPRDSPKYFADFFES